VCKQDSSVTDHRQVGRSSLDVLPGKRHAPLFFEANGKDGKKPEGRRREAGSWCLHGRTEVEETEVEETEAVCVYVLKGGPHLCRVGRFPEESASRFPPFPVTMLSYELTST